MFRRLTWLTFSILILAAASFAQSPAKWSLASTDQQKSLKTGQTTTLQLKADIDNGWHLYALDQPSGGPIATSIKVIDAIPFDIAGKITTPAPTIKPDPNFLGTDGKPLQTRFFEKQVTFSITVKASKDDAEVSILAFFVKFQLCNETNCLPPKTVQVSFTGTEDVKRSGIVPAVASTAESSPTPSEPSRPDPTTINSQTPFDLGPFIWLAITLGALSLLTPCVFPMIPITVSYFTNHAAGSRAKSLKLATIYSLGIIATFTIMGMLLAIFVGAAGINLFAANPWVNILITAIFLFFAFNLFGAYEITVPTGILTKLDALTRSKEGEGSGVIGALLMGLTFTLTSFTCTSPFVGTILVSASQGNWRMPLVGMLAFSTVFALPFFILALVPQWVSQLPRAGGWMNSVKVAMGFLEVAAAMKFVSNVDLVWKWGIFTRPVVLAIWIAIGAVLSLYLLGKFQLSHDTKPERLGAFRMIAAVVSLAVSFYLLTGLFGAKLGELESFLPPDLNNSTAGVFNKTEPAQKWEENDYDGVLAKAKADKKLVFIDFTGYTCTNCRWMEANVFPKKEVEAEMGKFILARLYTDGEGDVYERQQQMEQDVFGTVALPFYAIVDGDGKTVATFPGLTRNTAEFVDFLQKAQKN
jgi:thiol:disulfide interchange protein DsbD